MTSGDNYAAREDGRGIMLETWTCRCGTRSVVASSKDVLHMQMQRSTARLWTFLARDTMHGRDGIAREARCKMCSLPQLRD